MEQKLLKATLLIASASLVISCSSTNTQGENTTIGGVTGAVVGGVLGSAVGGGAGKVVAIGVGAIAGALIGGYVGHSMDHADCAQSAYALDHTPKHKTHHWVNKDTGAVYSVTPTTGYFKADGQDYCRKYTMSAVIEGKKQTVHGVACRQKDGTWKSIE